MKKTIFALLSVLVNLSCYAQMLDNKLPDSLKPKMQDQFSVVPARVFFTLNRGESGSSKVTISNRSSDTVQYKLYLNDWLRDTTGGHTYLEPGAISRSCARWITLDKTFIELKPKETQDVQVKMDIPDSADAVNEMKWAMLFIETKDEKKVAQKGNLRLINKSRIGVHILQTPPSLTSVDVKVLNFCAQPGGAKNEYRVVCQNTGNMQFDVRSYIELMPVNKEGEKISITPVTFPLFPDQVRYVKFAIPESVPKGKYNAVAIVEAGSEAPLEAAQAVIEIK